jgi:AraC-like DNA-binding protein
MSATTTSYLSMARRLGCTVEGLRLAKEQLTCSPLYGLARRHFLALCEQASDLAPDVMTMIGRSTVELVGAMVVTAADGRDADAYLEQTFLVRLTAYVEANLQDSDLGAAQIAAAHYISVRQLYNVWARDAGGPTLGQSIMSRRLARAHGRLAEGSPARLNISAVARQCGYTNVSHFSRRFRGAYGVSRTEWRAAHGVPLSWCAFTAPCRKSTLKQASLWLEGVGEYAGGEPVAVAGGACLRREW